jgi:hypothetical protein
MEELDQSSLHSLLEHLETNLCLGRESNPGRLRCRQALKQRAIRIVYIFALRTTIGAGIFTLLLSWGFSPRHPQMYCNIYSFSNYVYFSPGNIILKETQRPYIMPPRP